MVDQVCLRAMNEEMKECFFLQGCLSPFEPFSTVNRYETAALSGIIVIEVLTSLEHFLIDLSQIWKEGVLVQLFHRTLIPLLYR